MEQCSFAPQRITKNKDKLYKLSNQRSVEAFERRNEKSPQANNTTHLQTNEDSVQVHTLSEQEMTQDTQYQQMRAQELKDKRRSKTPRAGSDNGEVQEPTYERLYKMNGEIEAKKKSQFDNLIKDITFQPQTNRKQNEKIIKQA